MSEAAKEPAGVQPTEETYEDVVLFGGDQNPLRQGVLRAVLVATRYPGAQVVYTQQTADRLGKPGSKAMNLRVQSGAQFSFTFDHPWTLRVDGIPQRVAESMAKLGLPPMRYELDNIKSGETIENAIVGDVILAGFKSELDWANRLGADPGRLAYVEELLQERRGRLLPEAVQELAFALLEADGVSIPDNLKWMSITDIFGGNPDNLHISSLPGFDRSWVWSEEERPGAGGMPKGPYLVIESLMRGYHTFATSLPYWDRVEQIMRENGVEAHLKRYMVVNLADKPPVESVAHFLPKGFNFPAGTTVESLDEAWNKAWRARPTLIQLFTRGVGLLKNVDAVVDGGKVRL